MSEDQGNQQGPAKKYKPPGRWKKGESGNPAGRPARNLALATVEPISLGESSRELVQTLGGQLRALRRIGEEREFTAIERTWLLDLADRCIRLEESRGRLLLAALELKLPEEHRKKLIALFSDGPPPAEPAPNDRTPARP